MKSILLAVVATLMMLVSPFPARASLGGDITSVQADQTRLQGTLQSTKNASYTIEEVKAPTGLLVREYLSTSGQVFAVTWQGPTRPNLQQVLGTYFTAYTQAAQAQTGRRVVRGPVVLKQGGLVVEMGGHMRWVVGRAYVSSMVPPTVQMEEIR
ncbi:MAG: DUF2844 domain-containing protein [Candidatus Acidiferrales bacterium]